jgi:hypothetical protein
MTEACCEVLGDVETCPPYKPREAWGGPALLRLVWQARNR